MDEIKLKELLFKTCVISGDNAIDAVDNTKRILNDYDYRLVFEFSAYLVSLLAEKYKKTFAELRKEELPKEFILKFLLSNEEKINEDFINLKSVLSRIDFYILENNDFDILRVSSEEILERQMKKMIVDCLAICKIIEDKKV